MFVFNKKILLAASETLRLQAYKSHRNTSNWRVETGEKQGASNGSERRVADVTHAQSLACENQLQRQFLIIT